MMHKTTATTTLAIVLLGALAAPALAHSGHGSGFAITDGFLHPLHGLDHLLAMLAVGFWAAQIDTRALWVLPVTFVSAMALGALAAAVGLAAGGIEAAIVGSVIVLGAAIASKIRMPLAVAMGICALFAVAHGQAHGLEIPDGASIAGYFGGFIGATALLHLAGAALGRLMMRLPLVSRAIGVAISAAGVTLA